MIENLRTVETKHEGMIHDVQYDYYGQHMATCSSDGTVRVSRVLKSTTGEEQAATEIAAWQAHNGPVWQLAWAHPKFGQVLASCGFDKKVTIWGEGPQRDWREIISFETESSINTVSFAPWECGLKLLAGGLDGNVWFFSRRPNDEREQPVKFQAHGSGVNSVSWGSLNHGLDYIAEDYLQKYAPLPRFATASCDKTVKVWTHQEDKFVETSNLTDANSHADYVRDVAWSPKTGASEVLVSCSEDGTIIFWSNSKPGEDDFRKVAHKKCEGPAWRVSWAPDGKTVAVSVVGSSSENIVEIYRENEQGSWDKIQRVSDC